MITFSSTWNQRTNSEKNYVRRPTLQSIEVSNSDDDYSLRLKFVSAMLTLYKQNEDLTVTTCDDAHFHLNISVNEQKCQY